MYGSLVSTTATHTAGGSIGSSITLSTANIPAHNHGININDPGHKHYLPENDTGGSFVTYAYNKVNGYIGWQIEPNTLPGYSGSQTGGNIPATSGGSTGISASNSNNAGSGTAFTVPILPSFDTVNMIIKY